MGSGAGGQKLALLLEEMRRECLQPSRRQSGCAWRAALRCSRFRSHSCSRSSGDGPCCTRRAWRTECARTRKRFGSSFTTTSLIFFRCAKIYTAYIVRIIITHAALLGEQTRKGCSVGLVGQTFSVAVVQGRTANRCRQGYVRRRRPGRRSADLSRRAKHRVKYPCAPFLLHHLAFLPYPRPDADISSKCPSHPTLNQTLRPPKTLLDRLERKTSG